MLHLCKKKRLLSALLVFVMVISVALPLTGCGERSTDEPQPSDAVIAAETITSEEVPVEENDPDNNLEPESLEPVEQEEDPTNAEELNSFSMMYYLAITAEEIRTSKDSRVALEDIYSSLLNDINPEAIDEITQDQ